MIDAAFAIPGDIEAATGGYAYDRKVLQLLPAAGVNGHYLELPGSFPEPTDADLTRTKRLIDQIHPETPILFDGLAYGALPPGFMTSVQAPVVALVHHPLALETGLDGRRKRALITSERAALAAARAVIATSPLTARTLARDYDVPAEKLTVAEPGTEPAIRSTGTGVPFTMLAVGSLIPRKGYGFLIKALAELEREDWMLTIVGSAEHDPTEANRLRELLLATGLRGKINLAGRMPGKDLARLYARADLFVMPSLFEGYGMVLAEAMARGLAIVCTTGGASAETVPDPAAIKVEPGDAAALAAAIRDVMDDKMLAERMSSASWQAGLALPRWPASVAKIANVLTTVHQEQLK